MLRKLTGIVINRKKYIGIDNIITLYTKQKGKIDVIAKGAKNPKSRLKSGVEQFVLGEYLIFKKGSSTIGKLSEVEVLNYYTNIRNDIKKLFYAEYFTELINKITEYEIKNTDYFYLLKNVFELLEENIKPEIIRLFFDVNIIRILGFYPDLNKCCNCGKETNAYYLKIEDGQIYCKDCKTNYSYKITKEMINYINLLSTIRKNKLKNIKINKNTLKSIQNILENYIKYHAEIQKINTLEFLKNNYFN